LALWSKVTVLIPIPETQPYPNKYTYKIWQDVSTEGRHLKTRDPRDTCNLSRWVLTSSLVFGTHHFLQTITKVALVGLMTFLLGHDKIPSYNLQGYHPLNFLYADISKYGGPSDPTGKNQAGPTMFSAYRSESPVKIYSLLRSGIFFLFVGPSNSVFKSWPFLQFSMFISLNKRFLWITCFDYCVILKCFSCSKNWID
jgi:hypothetical protein